MVDPVRAAVLCLLAGGLCASATSAAAEALLWRKVEIPEALLGRLTNRVGERVRFGGDIRLGDLDNDSDADLLVFRSVDGGMKPAFLGALTLDGEVLWQLGEVGGGDQPDRPCGDPRYRWRRSNRGRGPDGRWRATAALAELGECRLACPRRRHRSGENREEARSAPQAWRARSAAQESDALERPQLVRHRILIANFRGLETPRDVVIKLGQKLFAFDQNLELLWIYDIPRERQEYSRHTAYIPDVGDLDGDGRDEVTGGYYLLGPDGKPIWEKKLGPHMDSVAIAPWDNGRMRVFASGHGHALDRDGRVVLRVGAELLPHGQELRVADFDIGSPGPEMLIRTATESACV